MLLVLLELVYWVWLYFFCGGDLPFYKKDLIVILVGAIFLFHEYCIFSQIDICKQYICSVYYILDYIHCMACINLKLGLVASYFIVWAVGIIHLTTRNTNSINVWKLQIKDIIYNKCPNYIGFSCISIHSKKSWQIPFLCQFFFIFVCCKITL